MFNDLDPLSWEYNSLDALIDDLYDIPFSNKRLVITRYSLMQIVNFELINIIIPAWFSYHSLKGAENIVLFGLYNQGNQFIAGFYLHFICSSLLLIASSFFYTNEALMRHENRWGVIFSLMAVWKVSVDVSAAWMVGTQCYIREPLNIGFMMLVLQDFVDYIHHRLEYFLHELPKEIEVLVLPYQLIEAPWMISWYVKWIDDLVLDYVMTAKPPALKIEYDGRRQLGYEFHDVLIYWSLICDIHKLHPSIHLDLKHNHLFNELSFAEIDAFITSIPFEKRKQIDLSENGESDYQRAFGPVLQMSRQYHLNENVGKEILSFLPR